MTTLNSIIDTIKRKFADGCSNGFILGWGSQRFQQSLESLLTDHKIINDTDFNYSYCNSYKTLPGKDIYNNTHIMFIKISYIADALTLFITEYSEDKRRGRVIPLHECTAYDPEIIRVRDFFKNIGYREINGKEGDIEVDGISLELSGIATVDKCLFDDFE